MDHLVAVKTDRVMVIVFRVLKVRFPILEIKLLDRPIFDKHIDIPIDSGEIDLRKFFMNFCRRQSTFRSFKRFKYLLSFLTASSFHLNFYNIEHLKELRRNPLILGVLLLTHITQYSYPILRRRMCLKQSMNTLTNTFLSGSEGIGDKKMGGGVIGAPHGLAVSTDLLECRR